MCNEDCEYTNTLEQNNNANRIRVFIVDVLIVFIVFRL